LKTVAIASDSAGSEAQKIKNIFCPKKTGEKFLQKRTKNYFFLNRNLFLTPSILVPY
jgi:hypothetical protein